MRRLVRGVRESRRAKGRSPYLVLLLLIAGGLVIGRVSFGIDPSLEAIRDSGRLIVVTGNSPTTYYLGRDGTPQGFEVDLVEAFAASLGVEVEFKVVDTVPMILDVIANGDAHIAAAGLTVTAEREPAFRFTPPYLQVHQVVVCREGGRIPAGTEELLNISLTVSRGTSHEEALRAAAEKHPGLVFEESDRDAETLMRDVWEGKVECTVADEPVFQVTRRHYPELVSAFDLTEEESFAWVVAPDAEELAQALDDWFAHEGTAREIDRLTAAHFGFFRDFDYVNLARFRSDIDEILPDYELDLRTASRRNELPWRLVAAMAYQESKWDPDAVSATGVRGFMMLTQSTAGRVGVSDRSDAKESIWGGARYFADLLARVPEEVTGDDRYWFALAAYNMGMGHVFDARTLAARQGLDKNIWVDVKKVLPLLSEKKHYSTLRYGYARGYEARRYVEQVRTYWHMLKERR